SLKEELNRPFTPEEIRDAVARRRNSRQTDESGDLIAFYKCLKGEAWELIARVFNKEWQSGFECLESEENRNLLMTNTVSLLYKRKGDRTELDNYRGIVNASILTKVLSACLLDRFESILRKTRFLSPRQGGFRPGHQVDEKIFLLRRIAEDVAKFKGAETEVGKLAVAILLDIKKAYPSFPFKIFQRFFELWGIDGTPFAAT
ncbi:unnamed protein product, partial [Amoebophrya sp. A25]